MTIDERLERLTERHEALTDSVQMLLTAQREGEVRITRFEQGLSQTAANLDRLVGVVETLADIVRGHEDRLNGLEGTR